MYELINDECEESKFGHDMEIKIQTIEDVRLDYEMKNSRFLPQEYLMVRVVCRNCNLVAWERFKSFDLVQEVK